MDLITFNDKLQLALYAEVKVNFPESSGQGRSTGRGRSQTSGAGSVPPSSVPLGSKKPNSDASEGEFVAKKARLVASGESSAAKENRTSWAGICSQESLPIGERSVSVIKPSPVLVECGGVYFWDFSRIDLISLLLPETIFSDRAKSVVGQQIARDIDRILSQGTSSLSADIKSLDGYQQFKYKQCKLKMFDYLRQCAFFDSVGKKLRDTLPKDLVEELDSKRPQDYLSVKEGFISLELTAREKVCIAKGVEPSDINSAETVCNSQKYRYSQPHIDGEKFVKATAPKIQGVLQKVLGKMVAGIQLQYAPEFIGFVPPEIADPIAGKTGFTDSNWSTNFLHGKYSHLLALAFLSRETHLTSSTLNAFVTHDLWTDLLDLNPYSRVEIEKIEEHEYLIHNRSALICPFSPFAFQQMLCTGEVSATLRDISDMFEGISASEYSRFAEAFQEKVTPGKLLKMAQNIQLLEHVIALQNHGDRLKIEEDFNIPTLGLVPLEAFSRDNPYNSDGLVLGNFVRIEQTRKILASAAKRAFQRGDKVVAISRVFLSPLEKSINWSSGYSQQEIKKLEDFDVESNFKSFIVWPSQSVPATNLNS